MTSPPSPLRQALSRLRTLSSHLTPSSPTGPEAQESVMGGGPLAEPETLLLVFPFPEPTAILERLKERFPYVKVVFYQMKSFKKHPWETGDVPPELYREATILVTIAAVPTSAEAVPNLKFIHFLSAGTNHITNTPIYKSSKIPLTTSSGIHGPPIAEWTLLTMLVHSHAYPLLYEWQKEHHWASNSDHNRLSNITDRVGMRIGILGYGSIGRQVARVCAAMGMTVLAYTASPRATPESRMDDGYIVPGTGDPEGIYPSAWYSGTSTRDLHNFLAQDLDHLLISLPLTPATTHLLAAPEFAILSRRKTFISNISRGAILHQADLVAALKSGQLRGAALDVADPEPLPKDDPLWDAPNLVITPHISGLGVEYVGRAFEVLELNLRRREEGRGMVNVVDRERGY